jgi:hypothetical protein
MSVDIRRMSKEELDELNRQAKVWRERNNPQLAERVSDPIPTVQMDLPMEEQSK